MKSKQPYWGSLDPFYEAGPVLGRSVANGQFLSRLLQADPFEEYHFFLADGKQIQALRRSMERRHHNLLKKDRIRLFHRRELPGRLHTGGYHCFHLSDCVNMPGPLAAVRNRFSPDIFPITSTTHSLSYARFTRDFLAHLWPGTTTRDCIVATSTGGRRVVENYLEALQQGFGLDADMYKSPRVELIPLGVDCEALTPVPEEERKRLRQKDDIQDKTRLVLVLGRISHQSKMDLLPLLRAFQRLASGGKSLRSVCLMLAGWADPKDDYPQTLSQLARNIGLELRLEISPDDARKQELLAMADLFVTIADNPQETFGLTVLEAGASGLPVVASDYDGYRDLVLDGQTGRLISTIGPACADDVSLMAPLLYENHAHQDLSQQTVVEVPALAEALDMLLSKPAAAQRMGALARQRVLEHYDWPRIIQAYVQLWERLWEQPAGPTEVSKDHPLGFQFTRIFSHYASSMLDEKKMLRWSKAGQAVYRKQDYPLVYAGMESLVRPERVERLLFLARKPCRTDVLVEELVKCCGVSREEGHRLILWALKQDLLEPCTGEE